MEIDSKDILYKAEASYVKGQITYGGMVIITNEYFIFKPHTFNVFSQEMSISLKDIANISQADKKLWGISKLIMVTAKDGRSEYFYLLGNKDIIVNTMRKAAGLPVVKAAPF
jgi:hypothetical protein